jgi:hypothetical protein
VITITLTSSTTIITDLTLCPILSIVHRGGPDAMDSPIRLCGEPRLRFGVRLSDDSYRSVAASAECVRIIYTETVTARALNPLTGFRDRL